MSTSNSLVLRPHLQPHLKPSKPILIIEQKTVSHDRNRTEVYCVEISLDFCNKAREIHI